MVLLAACAVISACGTLPRAPYDAASVSASQPSLADGFEQVLETAPADTRVTLDSSPWGSDVGITIHAPYHAASGRTCRELTIDTDAMRRPGLVCRLSESAWEPVRVLHHAGRPVGTPGTEQTGGRGEKR